MAEHCLDQIIRFGNMLNLKTVPDRTPMVLIAQLSFNLGRYVEISEIDGRTAWQQLEKCVNSGDYKEIVAFAVDEKAKLIKY